MYYSSNQNAFFPPELKNTYEEAGTWPDDIVEVDDETWQTYGIGQPPEGKQRVAGDNGLPTWEDIPPEPADTRRARAITAIDTAAGTARTAFASNGAFVDAEYEQALASAQSWTEAGRPTDDVPDDVQAWADAAGNTAEWAADDILSTAAQWRAALTAIRRVRLVGKEAIRNAAYDSDFDAIATAYCKKMEEISSQYQE